MVNQTLPPVEGYEAAAREVCELLDIDPDRSTYAKGAEWPAPNWVWMACDLRKHDVMNIALVKMRTPTGG